MAAGKLSISGQDNMKTSKGSFRKRVSLADPQYFNWSILTQTVELFPYFVNSCQITSLQGPYILSNYTVDSPSTLKRAQSFSECVSVRNLPLTSNNTKYTHIAPGKLQHNNKTIVLNFSHRQLERFG